MTPITRPIPARLLALTLVLAPALATAQSEGDPTAGRSLAEEYCTDCHDIERGGAFKEYPPSFAAIAIFRDAEQIRSRIYFPPWHASMPQFSALLWPDEVDDLVAYILSLEE
ncbi:c-type cytochrome [Oceanibium sediminis]|uniref:c-type cytochrome n=1 Tax=Oceanibium sediminis TaxID=2026339 RepID=UPI000DD36C88|nr:c-type cytochrome [Oceanibium sediminis]